MSPGDEFHAVAADYYRGMRKPSLVTTNAVLYETYNWLALHRQRRAIFALRDRVEAAARLGLIDVIAIDTGLERAAFEVFEQFASAVLTMTDCLTAAAARRLGVQQIFGFDRDFEMLGFELVPGYRRTR